MTRHTPRKSLACLTGAAAILLLSGSVFAQDGPRRGPSDALRGPSVNDRAMPRDERFGDSMMEGRRRDTGMMNYRILVGTIGDLADHENRRLRLSEEQADKLAGIREGFEKQLREYMVEAREQTQNLRRRVEAAREDAGDDREAVRELMERARARAQQIRDNAPKSDKAEAQMWEVLSQAQQRFVKAQIEERTDQMMRERQMQRDRAQQEQRETDGRRRGRPDAEGDDPMRPGAERPTDRRPEGRDRGNTDMGPDAEAQRGPRAERQTDRADPEMRRWGQLFQRIQRLTPEQQERLFNMINSTLDRVDAANNGEGREGRRGADRPRRPSPEAEGDSDRPTDARPERRRRGGQEGPRA